MLELDLTDVGWPDSLLRFNEVLKDWPSLTNLQVRVRDPHVFERVKMIVQNSGHRITRIERVQDVFRIFIWKTENAGHRTGVDESDHE